jgi:nuclear-control-of-ATPase protein 2
MSVKDITAKGLQQDLLPPLTNGLIILSLTHLRDYASEHLPSRSRLYEGFLEDISDLEDPKLGRKEKIRVVDRMWRSWATPLGWNTAAGA